LQENLIRSHSAGMLLACLFQRLKNFPYAFRNEMPLVNAQLRQFFSITRRHSVERIYLRQRYSDCSVNKTILKPLFALAARRQYVYLGFSRRKILRRSAARLQPMQGCKVPQPIRYWRKQSGSGIWTMIQIGLKS